MLSPGYPGLSPLLDVFRQGLHELGYVENQNLVIESRSAEGNLDRLPALAAEVGSLKVDVIVAPNTPAALAAHEADAPPQQDREPNARAGVDSGASSPAPKGGESCTSRRTRPRTLRWPSRPDTLQPDVRGKVRNGRIRAPARRQGALRPGQRLQREVQEGSR